MSRFPIMIDSGAYTVWAKGRQLQEKMDRAKGKQDFHEWDRLKRERERIEIKIEDYIAFCHEVLKDFPQAVCVNLDVIDEARPSFENWKHMRESGIDALPVWHVVGDPECKFLRKYLNETNHIGLGAIASMSSSRRKEALDRVWENYLIDSERMPAVKVHGMGITSFPLMLRYPWHSLDSTAWIQSAMYGHAQTPKQRGGTYDYGAKPTKIGFSTLCSDKRKKGKHYLTLSPSERARTLRYLKEKEFRLGFEWKAEDGRVVVDPGVASIFRIRADLNAEFYGSFVSTVPWPRPFLARERSGFNLHGKPESGAGKMELDEGRRDHTILYLSGSATKGENYILKNRERLDHVGVLLSYNDLRRRGVTWRRLENLKGK